MLASGRANGELCCWDVAAGKAQPLLLEHLEERIRALAFDAGGNWLACGADDGSIWLWDLSVGGAGSRPFESDHLEAVSALAFDPSASHLASASDDGLLCIWDIEAGESAACRMQPKAVQTLCFDDQGEYLATGAAGGSVH